MKLRASELRSIIRESIEEAYYDQLIEEGFFDKLKNLGKAAMLSLTLASSAQANVPSSGPEYTTASAPEEGEGAFEFEGEDGEMHKFKLLCYVKVDGKRYAGMLSLEDDLVYIFRVRISKGGDVSFTAVEDDAEWERAKAAVEEKLHIEDDDEDDEESAR